jgi:peptide/nickel transport system permease protein
VSAASAQAGFAVRACRHASFAIGAAIASALLLAALLSLIWTPYSATALNLRARLAEPGAAHWLGTDQFGRDVLSMLIVGAQTSIAVGVVAVGLGLAGGVAIGLLASARRGWVEEAVMRITDFTYAFPVLLVAILITAGWGPGAVNAILAIGVYNVAVFARVSRGAANAIWSREFVLASRAAGRGAFRITLEHVLPNIASVLIVQATVLFAIAILAEAALSYLGLGAQPPTPSWGRMLSEAQTYMFLAPRLAIFPGVAIALAVLGLNLLGDGLRDLLDPRLAHRR